MSYPRSLQLISDCKIHFLVITMYESLLRKPPQATDEGGSSLQLKTKHAQTLCGRLPKTVSCLLKIRKSRAARKDLIYQSCNRRPSIVKSTRMQKEPWLNDGTLERKWKLTKTYCNTSRHQIALVQYENQVLVRRLLFDVLFDTSASST